MPILSFSFDSAIALRKFAVELRDRVVHVILDHKKSAIDTAKK
ncbi:hypothetical protein [Spirulina sp. 06S082]|nr:hypothetical protein [Spirulina sp. 06S082]MEA5472289.1 hypothetical protein [Spirulina sp. 06S082]